jgi:hypothetical protein
MPAALGSKRRLVAGAWFAAAAVAGTPAGAGSGESADAAKPGPSSAECAGRANGSADRLLECIREPDLWQHLAHFQAIADRHPGPLGHGNRDTGSSGYRESVAYVARLMRQAGYVVRVQPYAYRTNAIAGVPRFEAGGASPVFGREWAVARHSPGGHVVARAQAASASGTGCDASELGGFVAGRVAVLERGACTFDTQVRHAATAGAAAVVLFDAAGEDGASSLPQRNGRPAEAFVAPLRNVPDVPVIGVLAHAAGRALQRSARAGAPPLVRIDIDSREQAGIDYNVIAESPFGDPAHVVVVDAHLDAIYGAGILDNASGSTTILDIALMLARTPTRNRLRYIWFGGEELGLLGSKYYTADLSDGERHRIAFDIDVDVTATPNYDYLIANPADASNRDTFPGNVIPQSRVGTKAYKDYFDRIGVPVRSADFGNDGTDSNAFSRVGIPNTGILTQQDCCKQLWEVTLWGGSRGDYEGQVPGFDKACVDKRHRWCDNLSNNDPKVLAVASKATAFVVLKMAEHPFDGSD